MTCLVWGLFQLRWAVGCRGREMNSIYFCMILKTFSLCKIVLLHHFLESECLTVSVGIIYFFSSAVHYFLPQFVLIAIRVHFGHVLQISLWSFQFFHFAAVHEEMRECVALAIEVILKCDTLYLFIWVVCLTWLKDYAWKNKHQNFGVISGHSKESKSYLIQK